MKQFLILSIAILISGLLIKLGDPTHVNKFVPSRFETTIYDVKFSFDLTSRYRTIPTENYWISEGKIGSPFSIHLGITFDTDRHFYSSAKIVSLDMLKENGDILLSKRNLRNLESNFTLYPNGTSVAGFGASVVEIPESTTQLQFVVDLCGEEGCKKFAVSGEVFFEARSEFRWGLLDGLMSV